MSERDNLLPKKSESTRCDAQFKISLFAMIVGCAMQLREITETQFVYAHWENRTSSNKTSVDAYMNTSFGGDKCADNSSRKNDNEVQTIATEWSWYISIATYGISLPVIVLVGPLSDRTGRKRFLILNTGLTTVSYLARAYIVYQNFSLYWYLLMCAIEGIAGTHYSYHLLSCSILTETTTSGNRRPMAFAVYETMLGIGVGCSQLLAGYLIKFEGFLYPYIIAGGMYFIVFILVILILDDGNYNSKSKTSKNMDIATQICLLSNANALREGQSRNHLFTILFIFFLHHFPLTSLSSLRTIYVLGTPFCWTSVHIGWYGAGADLAEYILCTVILKCLLFCMKDVWIITLGFLSTVLSLALYGSWQFDWIIYTATAVGVIRTAPISMFKAILSRMVLRESAGSMFSFIYLVELLSRLGSSTAFTNIYHETRTTYKGMVFFLMAALPLLGLLMFLCLHCVNQKGKLTEITVESPSLQTSSVPKINPKENGTHHNDDIQFRGTTGESITKLQK